MKIQDYTELPQTAKTCCKKTTVRQLTPEANGRQSDVKLFEMQPGGYSPLHNHPQEHKILVIEGEGTVFDDKKEIKIQKDDVVFIASNEQHQFKNSSDQVLKFLAVTADTDE